MFCQSHWKTQIEGLTKQQFVPFSVHIARVCIRGLRWDQCHVPPYFFVPRAINVLPPPPEQRIHPTGPPPHRTNFPKGSSCHQLAGLNACAFGLFLGVRVAVKSNFEHIFLHDVDAVAAVGKPHCSRRPSCEPASLGTSPIEPSSLRFYLGDLLPPMVILSAILMLSPMEGQAMAVMGVG
jgi:hypothetical protein